MKAIILPVRKGTIIAMPPCIGINKRITDVTCGWRKRNHRCFDIGEHDFVWSNKGGNPDTQPFLPCWIGEIKRIVLDIEILIEALRAFKITRPWIPPPKAPAPRAIPPGPQPDIAPALQLAREPEARNRRRLGGTPGVPSLRSGQAPLATSCGMPAASSSARTLFKASTLYHVFVVFCWAKSRSAGMP